MLKKNLRKLITATILIIATLFLFTPMQGVNALPYPITYTVMYSCHDCCPDPYGEIQGVWSYDCEGTETGWGLTPGSDCTKTDVAYGDPCE